ncbi:MAG: 30S ribosomal protein S14 [Gammaproteobacteria bacterium]
MAKTCMIEREKRRTALVKKHKAKRDALREVLRDPKVSIEEKFAAQAKMQKLPVDSNTVRQRNRCLITGRSRGVYRKFGLSRTKLREFAMLGMIPGLRMASW